MNTNPYQASASVSQIERSGRSFWLTFCGIGLLLASGLGGFGFVVYKFISYKSQLESSTTSSSELASSIQSSLTTGIFIAASLAIMGGVFLFLGFFSPTSNTPVSIANRMDQLDD